MTGFGRASAETAAGRVSVEIRSVNNRGLDVKLRSRDLDGATEHAMLAFVRGRVRRGSLGVNVDVSAEAQGLNVEWLVGLDQAVAELSDRLGKPRPTDLGTLVAFAALAKDEVDRARGAPLTWAQLEPVAARALEKLDESRHREGDALARDLKERRLRLVHLADALEARSAGAAQRAGERLRQRLAAVIGESAVDPQRLAQEVAILADRSDVTEELVRLRAHLGHFEALLEGQAPAPDGVGRRMDFWLQEMGREFNTLASKSQDAQMSALVVDAKAELEKIREQAQNIE